MIQAAERYLDVISLAQLLHENNRVNVNSYEKSVKLIEKYDKVPYNDITIIEQLRRKTYRHEP